MSVRNNNSHAHSAYSIALQIVAEFPIVPIVIGASAAVVASAFALYISTGSPRWKGAPGLSKKENNNNKITIRNVKSKQCGDLSHTSLVSTTMYTSTKTPWATSKEETTQKTQLERDARVLLCDSSNNNNNNNDNNSDDCDDNNDGVVVDHIVNSPRTSPCNCYCQHYQIHPYTTSQQQQQQSHYSSHVCDPIVPGVSSLSLASDGTGSVSLNRTLSENLSNNSSVNTPTVHLSTCPSRHGVGLLTLGELSSSAHNERGFESSNNALEWNSLVSRNSVVSPGAPDIMTATSSEILPDSFPDSFGTATGYCCNSRSNSSSQNPLISYDECALPLRGYDWKRRLGENENVSSGKLRQTLSHLVGAATVSCSPSVQPLSDFGIAEMDHVKERSSFLSTSSHTTGGGTIKKQDVSSDRIGSQNLENAKRTDLIITDHHHHHNHHHYSGETRTSVNASNENICKSSSDEHRDDEIRRDVLHKPKPPPQLEAQLRSLEIRLEQQLRGSVGRCSSETTTTTTAIIGNGNGNTATTLIRSSPVSRNVESISSVPVRSIGGGGGGGVSSTSLANPSLIESDTVINTSSMEDASQIHRQTPMSITADQEKITTTTTPIPQTQPQHDRRVDDVFVRHRTEGGASYSLSLTYHDAHGSSRTIDTHPLPPLKYTSSRSTVITPPSTVITNVSASRWQTPTPLSSQGSGQSSCCLLNVVIPENSRTSATHSNNGNSSVCIGSNSENTTTTNTTTTNTTTNINNNNNSNNSISGGNRTHLVAPLPPLESTTGPRLQGVAGRRGELRIGAFLGGGWCGKVYECLNIETGEVLAAKQLMFDSKDPKLRHRLKQLELELEVLTMAQRHRMPWIVGYHGTEKRGHSVLMYLEYCARGSLLDYMMNHGNSTSSSILIEPTTLPSLVAVGSENEEASQQKIISTHSDFSQNQQESHNSSEQPPKQKESQQHQQEEQLEEKRDGEVKVNERDLEKKNTNASLFHSNSIPMSRVGTTSAEMPALPLIEVQRFTLQTVEALHFLHIHGYVHLDVKTANILVTENGNARLADFGCSMRLKLPTATSSSSFLNDHQIPHILNEQNDDDSTMNTTTTTITNTNTTNTNAAFSETCKPAAPPFPILAEDDAITELRGTAVYMAPEMIRFERGRIGTAGDVWSLGCVVMELATGAAPWRHVAKDKLRVLFRIGSAREDLPLPPSIVYAAEEGRKWLAQYNMDKNSEMHTANDAAMSTTTTNNNNNNNKNNTSSTMDDREHDNSDNEIGGAAIPREGEGEGEKRRRLEKRVDETNTEVSFVDPISHDTITKAELHRRMVLRVTLENFLSLCLRVHPEDRPSCEELLQHPFLTIN